MRRGAPARDCQPQVFAAVDLGSNRFHLVVARQRRGGLDARQQLTAEAMERALAWLARFGQRLRGVCAESVRAIGTRTLRRARNRPEFLARAEKALDTRIEIVSGREEARLIHLG